MSTGLSAGGSGRASNDEQLMRALHDKYAHMLWVYVLSLTNGDRGRSEDIVQETMLRAWKNPQVLDQSRGSPRSWLFTVAKRIVIDEWRSTRSRPEVVTDQLPELSRSDETDAWADQTVIIQALKQLSHDHRRVLLECYVRGASVAEAAVRLGIPPGTVKSRSHYALQALKLALTEIGGVQ